MKLLKTTNKENVLKAEKKDTLHTKVERKNYCGLLVRNYTTQGDKGTIKGKY